VNIPIDQLVAHPANPNRMSEATFEKLKGHIGRTGRYEAVVVRPFSRSPSPSQGEGRGEGRGSNDQRKAAPRPAPLSDGEREEAKVYQILNGHHRVRALEELGRTAVRCDVWDVDDTEALILVATLNSLAGEDVPEKREALLADLLKRFDAPRLADLLPESEEDLSDLLRSIDPPPVPEPVPPADLEPVEFLTFAVSPVQRATVEAALTRTGLPDRAAALIVLAEAYTAAV